MTILIAKIILPLITESKIPFRTVHSNLASVGHSTKLPGHNTATTQEKNIQKQIVYNKLMKKAQKISHTKFPKQQPSLVNRVWDRLIWAMKKIISTVYLTKNDNSTHKHKPLKLISQEPPPQNTLTIIITHDSKPMLDAKIYTTISFPN